MFKSDIDTLIDDVKTVERRGLIERYQAEFAQLNQLRFTDAIETEFHAFRNKLYYQRDKTLMYAGVLLYSFFLIGDYTLLIEPFNYYSMIARLSVIAFAILVLALIYQFKLPWAKKHAMKLVAMVMLAIGLHLVIISALCPFPFNYEFLLGLIPIMTTVPLILRLNARLCSMVNAIVCTAVALSLIVFTEQRLIQTQWPVLDRILMYFPYIFTGFLVGVTATGSFLAYFFERITRRQWLDKRISQLESENLQHLTKKFIMIARQDELTRIANRRYFFDKAREIFAQCQDNAIPISLIMLDVDFFKKYNDTYGHQAGDGCLRELAGCMQKQCRRRSDLLARYGGEEFIILLANTSKTEALTMAETIRHQVSQLDIAHESSPFQHVTISLGVTNLEPIGDISIQSVIKQADKALYHAKNTGRNRVAYADDYASAE